MGLNISTAKRLKNLEIGIGLGNSVRVLPAWPVLRHCLLMPYVPLPILGKASVLALNKEMGCYFESDFHLLLGYGMAFLIDHVYDF